MAARIIAQLLVTGGTVVFRAAAQAYRQAIISKYLTHASAHLSKAYHNVFAFADDSPQQKEKFAACFSLARC